MISPRLLFLIVGILWLGGASSSFGVLIVDWGGNYVTTKQWYANWNGTSQYGGFTGGNPQQLSPASGYSGTSGLFYGMMQASATFPQSSGDTNAVINSGSGDWLEIKFNSQSVNALFLWKQANFLNGLDSGVLNLAEGSTISMTLTNFTRAVPGRAVVRLGSSYYISSPIFSSDAPITLDLTQLSWFNYNPASSLSGIGSAVTIYTDGRISNVTEVGFFTGVNNTGSNAVRITSVEFNAVVAVPIPEPSFAIPALFGAMGVLIFRLRRKARSPGGVQG